MLRCRRPGHPRRIVILDEVVRGAAAAGGIADAIGGGTYDGDVVSLRQRLRRALRRGRRRAFAVVESRFTADGRFVTGSTRFLGRAREDCSAARAS